MGHTMRCVPLIDHILRRGHHIFFAGNGPQRRAIGHFGDNFSFVYLDGYNVTYSAANRVAQAGLLRQLPHIAASIHREHSWLEDAAERLQLHGIISDNRYGLFHSDIPSVILTHQLRVRTGMGRLADRLVQRMHYKYLNRFNATWVVDEPSAPGLADQLSHSACMPRQHRYVGLLSRFAEPIGLPVYKAKEHARVLVLLSGPEPARTQLSRMLWQQVLNYKGEVVFAEGSDDALQPWEVPPHITWYRRLNGVLLETMLMWADVVVCRSGYSTLMDLAALGRRAVLIPTPGQTEQEYLAKQLKKGGAWYSAPQHDFDLNAGISNALSGSYTPPSFPAAFDLHKPVLDEWLASL